MKPTDELYRSLETAYQYFNRELFEQILPPVVFTLQRQKGTLGYFVPDRWISPVGDFCHEISINPAHMGASRVIDVFQTLVHEMVHCWQFCHGDSPSNKGYHNKEWAYKMMSLGLQPSSTGEPGGSIVGYQMSDYIIEDGLFQKSCYGLIKKRDFQIPWIYRLTYSGDIDKDDSPKTIEPHAPLKNSPSMEVAVILDEISPDITGKLNPEEYLYSTYKDLMPNEAFFSQPTKKNTKAKYQCPSCSINAWAKPNVRLMCMECDLELLSL